MDYTVITLRFEQLNWECDMELPVRVKIKYLNLKILETLKAYDDTSFAGINGLRLSFNGNELSSELSLIDYNIWDGSILYAQGIA